MDTHAPFFMWEAPAPNAPSVLNGRRLLNALRRGADAVREARPELNALNVFPVADADTGNNMTATLEGALAETAPDDSAAVVTKQFADGALQASMGNSGILLAQFLDGLSEFVGEKCELPTVYLNRAVKQGAKRARQAISTPVEGTVLTAMDTWARGLDEGDLAMAVQRVEKACAASREQLPAATRAGVVDAGAAGFLAFVRGFTAALSDPAIANAGSVDDRPTLAPHPTSVSAAPNHRFCTEIILEDPRQPAEALHAQLADLGDSLIIAGGSARMKVHLHCDQPDEVAARLALHGRLDRQKVDDMVLEHAAHHSPLAQVAVVTDSACDLPANLMDRWQIHQVPLTIQWGEDQFLDRRTISASRFYRLLETRPEPPRTSQPPVGRFERLYRSLADSHEEILSIHLSSKLSGTLDSAKLAAKRLQGYRIRLVDGRQLTAGLGLIVLRTAECVATGASAAEAAALAESLIPRTQVFVAVQSLDTMIRGGRVSPLKGRIAKTLGVLPIISVDHQGRSCSAGQVFSFDAALRRILKSVARRSRGRRAERWALTHVDAPETASGLAEKASEILGTSPAYTMDTSFIIGAHAGRGAVGIAVQWDRA